MDIAVIGTGYVGLVTGSCLADLGNNVICVDIDKKKIETLKKHKSPIFESGLEKIIKKNSQNKRLTFTTNGKKAIRQSEIIINCVDTPSRKNGIPDLTNTVKVLKSFAQNLNNRKVFINKSTMPLKGNDFCKKIIDNELKKTGCKHKFDYIVNPEFLRQGCAVKDFMNPDRIIVGTDNGKSKKIIQNLYKPLLKKKIPILFTSFINTEIIKYGSNAFLATKLSFINSLAKLSEKTGGDIKEIAKGIGLDPRIGRDFLNAGVGYGGSCIPKDTEALIALGKKHKTPMRILEEAQKINTSQKNNILKKLEKNMEKKTTIAVLGLTFKPNTDDTREAPSKEIIGILQKKGYFVQAYDPAGLDNFKKTFPKNRQVKYAKTASEAIKNAHAVLLLTEWDEFKKIKPVTIKKLMKGNLVIDGRNIFSPAALKKAGLKYIGTGR